MSGRVDSVQSGDEQIIIKASPSGGLMSLSKYGKSRSNNMSNSQNAGASGKSPTLMRAMDSNVMFALKSTSKEERMVKK